MKQAWERLREHGHTFLFLLIVLILICIFSCVGYLVGRRQNTDTKRQNTNIVAKDVPENNLLAPALNVPNIDVYRLWSLVNDQRVSAGLSPLSLNPKLNQSAAAKCNDMVAKNYWSHNDPAGNTPWHFFTDAGVAYIHLAENLGEGFHSAQATVDAWMKSEEHKTNILDSRFTDVGYAVCKSDHFVQNSGGPALLVVQHFAQL